MSGAARLLGVHANTIRAWTDQGRLPCIRINDRGDRRYRDRDLLAFLEDAGLQPLSPAPFQSRLRPAAAQRLAATTRWSGAAAMPASPADTTAAGPIRPGSAVSLTASFTGDRSGYPVPSLPDEIHLLALVTGLVTVQQQTGDLDATLRAALRLLRDLGRFSMLAVGRWDEGHLTSCLTEGAQRARAWWKTVDRGLARVCSAEQRPLAASISIHPDLARRTGTPGDPAVQVYAPIGGAVDAWGVLIVEAAPGAAVESRDLELLGAIAGVLGLAVTQARLSASLAATETRATDDERELERTASWAAQLQSIQALGARLARLSTVKEIGHAICVELRDLIDYHNVRVYRVDGDDVAPVAWRGEVGEYVGEDGEQLRLQVGEGITGWVAQHGRAEYLPNAVVDPRAATIPGTEDDLDESMLLAPMRYEDRVIGVIVLSKLGLDQFDADDLRYLEIYASMAAQAMVNADAAQQLRAQSERLARQLETQRELIRVTESILSSLDPHTVVAEICDRLGTLVPVDTLGLDLYDAAAGRLMPMYARGVDAAQYLGRSISRRRGGQRVGRPQRAAAAGPGRAGGRSRGALRGQRPAGGRAHRRAPARPRGRGGRADPGAAGPDRALRGVGVRAGQPVRGPCLDRARQCGDPPGRRAPGHDGRAHRSQEPGHVRRRALARGGAWHALQPAHRGPRRLQVVQRPRRPRGRQPAAPGDRSRGHRGRPRHGRGLSLRRRRAGRDPARDRRGGRARGGPTGGPGGRRLRAGAGHVLHRGGRVPDRRRRP